MRTTLRKRPSLALHSAGRYVPAALLLLVAGGGVVSAILVKPWVPTHVIGLGRLSSIAVWLLLLLVARALLRGKRQAWLLSVALLVLFAVDTIMSHSMRVMVPATLALLLTFLILAPLFKARSDPGALARGYVLLMIGCLLLFGHSLIFLLLRHMSHHLFVPMLAIRGVAFLMVGVGVVEIMRPVLPKRFARTSECERARAVVLRYGHHSLAHYTIEPAMSYFWAESGQAFLGYRVCQGVAVVLGDPIGHEDELASLLQRFVAFCRRQDWEFAMYQASPKSLACLAPGSIHAIKVGEEALVDTRTFTLQGKVGAPVRHAIARAKRGDVSVSLWQGEPIPEAIFAGMKRVSVAWLADQHTYAQMGFSMGRFPADWSPDLLTAVAQGKDGEVLAYLTWTPLYRGNGWTLDNMRRAHQTVPGTMEYLIAESIEWAKARGFDVMSLSLAPLAGLREELQRLDDATAAPVWRISRSARLFQRSAAYLHRRGLLLGNYRSLYFFKQKYQPTWEPRYLVLSDASTLPRVLIALAVVHGMEWRTAAHDVWAFMRSSLSSRLPGAA